MYNGPSVAIRPSVYALVSLFLYTLKRLSSPFLHRTDVFQYVTCGTILEDKTSWKNLTKFQVKCTNTVQQKGQQKVHNNYVALLIKQYVFIKLVESLY